MSSATLNMIKSLRAVASTLRNFNQTFKEKYASDSHCDKKGFGFNKDDLFSEFSVKVWFSSWKGYYGNSGCTRIMSIYGADEDIKEAFVAALNRLQPQIFAAMADHLEKKAAGMYDRARAETEAALQLLKDLEEAERERT